MFFALGKLSTDRNRGAGVVLTVCQEEYLGSSALKGLEVGGWMVV